MAVATHQKSNQEEEGYPSPTLQASLPTHHQKEPTSFHDRSRNVSNCITSKSGSSLPPRKPFLTLIEILAEEASS